MIDIDRAEGFSPFRVWARGGQAPLRAQATLPSGLGGLSAADLRVRAALRPATLASQTSLPAHGSPQLSGPRKIVDRYWCQERPFRSTISAADWDRRTLVAELG
jgi:hypothetical protein